MNKLSSEQIKKIKNRGKRLQRLRNLTNLSRFDFCNKFNLKHGTLKGWEVGTATGLPQAAIKKLIPLFKETGVVCDEAWLMDGIGPEPQYIGIPSKINMKDQRQSELNLFMGHHKDTIYIEVNDDAMEPFFQKGDFVAGIKHSGSAIKECIEKNCILETKDGRILLRHLKSGKSKNGYNLFCLNINTNQAEPITYDIEIVSAAPILWIRHR